MQLYHTLAFDRPNGKRVLLRASSGKANKKNHNVSVASGDAEVPWYCTLIAFVTCRWNGRLRKVAFVRWYHRGAVEPVTGCVAARVATMRSPDAAQHVVSWYDIIDLDTIIDVVCIRRHPRRDGWFLLNRFASMI